METNNLYEYKYQNFQKAINRQEGAYVPNVMVNNGGSFFWSGTSIFDVAGKPLQYAEAITKVLDDMWMDGNVVTALTTTPRLSETFPTAELHIDSNGALYHVQSAHMKADEYDQLLADPNGYVANVLVPRKHPFLFEDRQKAKEALRVLAEENVGNFVFQLPTTNKWLAEKYGVRTFCTVAGAAKNPADTLFSNLRGFQGTLVDMRRHPQKVKAALEKLWEVQTAAQLTKPYATPELYLYHPRLVPTYLSPKQFREFFWPYEKQIIEWVANSGGKVLMALEGRWKNVWDCFKEVPKDSCILFVDDDDFLAAHAALGDHQILCGGLNSADTRLKTFDQMKDDVKRVIDTCAPGGGFLFMSNKVWVTPGDVNQTLIDCYNFAHEYSKK